MAGPRQFDEEADTAEVPKPPTREPIPFWKALGTEQQLKDGEFVWVILADVITRMMLNGPWTVTRRGPRMLQELTTSKAAVREQEIYVLSRDGVLCLQSETPGPGGTWETGQIVLGADAIAGEHVTPAGHADGHANCFIDIVRVTR